ncbi:MAG: HEAT repeat domain-containing protein [Lewinellaceae bacterium]|nr:HEAT repeat domain-containing protein [Phaeodactylibacter sp.]MCB0613817.1 HEAT repeat domain-containing protein [Phaeodactylibacter sp.]MCB9348580.1 HEAT repeat domain-containing protein [Lewinellaceae bacterium]
MRVLLMQANIFLLISTLLIIKPAVNALFISELGVEQLPRAFVMVAIFAAVISTLYSRLLRRSSMGRMMNGTLLSSIFILIAMGVLLRLNVLEGGVLYFFYLWVSIFGVLTASQFWILANLVFNAREAKRLFGFIGAGAIAGGIFGGYLTSLLAPSIGSENLPFLAAFLLSLSVPATRFIWKNYVEQQHTTFQRQKRIKGFSDHPLALIRQSRHLTFLAGIVGISVIVAKLVEYQFSAVAAAAISDPDELASFFGFWFSNFNVISLGIQLFLTRRVVGTFGVGYALFVLPAGIFIGATALLFFPELWAAVLIKLADGSLKQSINKAAIELLGLPIPIDIKNKTKTFIDVFIDSAATGLSGLMLIFLVSGMDLSPRFISILIVLLLLGWGYFALQVRREYIQSFKLKILKPSPEKKALDIGNESVVNGLKKVLNNGGERQIIYILKQLQELGDERFFQPVRGLLRHPSAAVRAEAIHNLYFYKQHSIVEEVAPLIQDTEQAVKVAAFNYLIEHSPENRLELMRSFLQDDDYRISYAALISLASETKDNPELKKIFELEERIRQKLAHLPDIEDVKEEQFSKIQLLKAIGRANIPALHATITAFLSDENPEVARQAIQSAGQTLSLEFISQLIAFLSNPAYKDAAQAALAHYGLGIIEHLQQFLGAARPGDVVVIRNLPPIVEGIESQSCVQFLFSLLDYEDLVVRLEALRSLNTLKNRFPHLKFKKKDLLQQILEEARLYQNTLSVLYIQARNAEAEVAQSESYKARKSLISLLERRLDGSLERMFRLVGLKYPPEDIIPIFKGVQSKHPNLRISAIEFLDNLLDMDFKKILIPIVETAMLETISEEAIRGLNLKLPTEFQCFELLLNGKDFRVKLAVLYLIGQLGNRQYLGLLDKYRQSPNEKVRAAAEKARQMLDL